VERAELRGALDESLAQRAALGRRLPDLRSPAPAGARTPGPPSAAWGAADADAVTPGAIGSDPMDAEAVDEEMRAVTAQIAALQVGTSQYAHLVISPL